MKFYSHPTNCPSVSALIDTQAALLAAQKSLTQVVDVFAVSFEHSPIYLKDSLPISLIALVYLQQDAESLSIYGSLLPATQEHLQILGDVEGDFAWIKAYLEAHQSPMLNLSAPLLLEPVSIPKPWGQEIWYTGIEARGQSKVTDGRFSVPLPWVLELFPASAPLTLLKILDPLADETLGNLYFELHEQKQEVYIVTHIDSQAWPDGIGQIQMGFCQEKRRKFESDIEFKQAYLKSVNDYKIVRNKIDGYLDQLQTRTQTDRTLLYKDFSKLTEHAPLIESERELRDAMNAFIYHHPLKVGDVVKVPSHVPHSLQHGVQVIEFQTPVYERKILSFGQKVLTQSDWDTQEALQIAQLDKANFEKLELISRSDAYQLERIVSFDDFQVQRLIAHQLFEASLSIEANTLIILIKGKASFILSGVGDRDSNTRDSRDSRVILPCEAYLLPAGAHGQQLTVEAGAIVLFAMPNAASWAKFG